MSNGPGRARCVPTFRFSSTVREGNRRLPSGTRARPLESRLLVGVADTSVPSRRIRPEVAGWSPTIVRNIVDLPAPLAPMIAKVSPALSVKLTSLTAHS